MPAEPYNILVIDDEEPIRRLLQKELAGDGCRVQAAENGSQGFEMVRSYWFDVVLLDLRLPDVEGLDLLIRIRESAPDCEVIMITGHGDIDTAVDAMKLGAYDFIRKPFNLDRLGLIVEKAHQRVVLSRENAALRHSAGSSGTPVTFIGKSGAVKEVAFLAHRVAPARIPVLITGESGVGKDVVARMIHQRSACAARPMIAKNCASLQKELARSELFGHVKGAFTGATQTRDGLMAFAHETTLFLDEIGELPMAVQASLLRALETQSYRRIGEKDERSVSVRFIFATNRRLAEEVSAGRFNEAFFHRINAFTIEIPPLRERREDLPLLVDYFLTTLSPDKKPLRVTDNAMDAIFQYQWPGNVRELRNVIERAIILAENNLVTERCLPRELVEGNREEASPLSLASVERRHITKMLDYFEGNRRKTADVLGISRKTLYRKLSGYASE